MDIKSCVLYLAIKIQFKNIDPGLVKQRVGNLHVCSKPHPHSLSNDVYSVTSHTRPSSRSLRATLKAGRESLGTRLHRKGKASEHGYTTTEINQPSSRTTSAHLEKTPATQAVPFLHCQHFHTAPAFSNTYTYNSVQ